MTDTITIKIHKATRQRLKLLAVRSGETLMDCITRLAIEETQRVDQQEMNRDSQRADDTEPIRTMGQVPPANEPNPKHTSS